MKITKYYLPATPKLHYWLASTVPEIGMLVWLSGIEEPILIGDINRRGECDGCRHPDMPVIAYARIRLTEIEVE